jgi:hypothetical protein
MQQEAGVGAEEEFHLVQPPQLLLTPTLAKSATINNQ